MNVGDVDKWALLLVDWTEAWHRDEAHEPGVDGPFGALLLRLHRQNHLLWHQEDIARRTDVEPSETARVKRAGDVLNQQRNDSIERIDEWLIETRYAHLVDRDLPLRTETPGSAVDRLSVLALKIFHMREQTQRSDATAAHREACARKLEILLAQRADLSGALARFVAELDAGTVRMKVYRQFKMYNDPTLNPQLYARPR